MKCFTVYLRLMVVSFEKFVIKTEIFCLAVIQTRLKFQLKLIEAVTTTKTKICDSKGRLHEC